MTLTFAYIDGRHTIHVADRRISVRDPNGLWVPRDDDAVKIVEPRGSMLLSYTGAAELEGDTAQWLLSRLNSVGTDIEHALSEVAVELTQIFSGPPYVNSTLTATISGWVEAPDGSLQPMVAAITNRHPSTRARLSQFKAKPALVDPLRGGWVATGVPLSQQAHDRVNAAIQTAAPKTVNADVIANIFLHAIRRESTPSNGISANAIGVVYPEALAQHARTSPDGTVTKIQTSDGMIMPGALALAFVPETVSHFSMIDLNDWDFSKLQIVGEFDSENLEQPPST